jgi:hypothetical protein
MKLAACFTVFNGLELLEKAIQQIEDHVDEIIVCHQIVSNKGNKSDSVHKFIWDLHTRTMYSNKWSFIQFHPDLSKNTKENERNKHQQMIDYARQLSCTHFFLAATDHFYSPDEFVFGKNTCQVHDYDVTFTKMYTYYKHPTWQLTPIENYYMPFIMKLKPDTKISKVPVYPVVVDPSVQVNTISDHFYIFEEKDLMLHHYSMIRQDIRDKFKNAAASIRWMKDQVDRFIDEYENYDLKENPGLEYFSGRKIKEVPDYFNIQAL